MTPAADGTSTSSRPATPAALRRPLSPQPARWRWPVALAGCLLVVLPLKAGATDPDSGGRRCAVVELYVREGHQRDTEAIALLHQFAARRTGIEPVIHTITATETARSRFQQITRAFGHDAEKTPLGYVAGRAAVGDTNDDLLVAVEDCLQIEVFTRRGCSRCARVKAWLPSLLNRFPGWRLVFRELTTDAAARERLHELVTASHTTAASVPVIHLCRRLIIGFDTVETTGRQIEETLTAWSRPCPAGKKSSQWRNHTPFRLVTLTEAADPEELQPLPLPVPSSNGAAAATVDSPTSETGIDLPWVGRIEWRRLGMPLFTLLVGLIDGFNPCAMWILVLLLSILVNLRDRWRMLAIAGTFILVSGAAYFAFMAAWLNVFLLIGYLRPVQLLLGGLAVIIGSIHVKDFVAFRKGLSLSIPEATKPGLTNRIRQIVTAANLPAAIAGAVTLAVLVNVVELLCTAGLPALYTTILTQQGLTASASYGYLLLYIAAYMFDDALLVAIVMITLSRRRLQETEGRWLKLLSGLVILFLGLVLILRPEWLGGLDR